jgi:hypothetical protein
MLRDVCPSDLSGFHFPTTEPWMHAFCTIGGAWAANKWVKIETNMLADVNEIRAFKGLPPMVGSHHFFPLVPPNLDSEGSKKV